MDGFQVMPMADAAPIGDLFIPSPATCTSSAASTSTSMKDGAIVSNSGHFNVELDLDGAGKHREGAAHGPRVRRRVHADATASGSSCWARAG